MDVRVVQDVSADRANEPDLADFYEGCGFEDPPMDLRQLNYEG